MTRKELNILHFNDVYNIEPASIEPVGGASRLMTAYHRIKDREPLVLFSGDCMNPSMISSVEKGNHMVPVLNELSVACAVLGNHEFDFGLDVLAKFMKRCNFPWLLTNVLDVKTKKPLANAYETYTLNWTGLKIGFIGLVEKEWLVTLPTLDLSEMDYIDFVYSARQKTQQLKNQGVDLVIALTHMAMANDKRLAAEVPQIDIVFGGHDHNYDIQQVDGKYVIKSGTDFQTASVIAITVKKKKIETLNIEKLILDSSIPENPKMKKIVDGFLNRFDDMTKSVVGFSDSDLDGLFQHIRSRETNLGNLVADIMVEISGADIAIINSGTFRSNCIHPNGMFTKKDLLRILPLFDPLCVLSISGNNAFRSFMSSSTKIADWYINGEKLVQALENGVSRYPLLDGRFPQVSSDLKLEFDPAMQPGHRIIKESLQIKGQFVNPDKKYNLCVKQYLACGKDGYSVLRDCPMLIDTQAGLVLLTAVQSFFEGVGVRSHSKSACHLVKNLNHLQLSSSNNKKFKKKIPTIEGRIIMKRSNLDTT